jgi:tripartite-type tricarboxylate transporter receptor subunit TctC
VRILAVFTPQRVPAIPDVPTMIESGYKDLEMNGWAGVVTTARTPTDIISRLDSEIGKALADPATASSYAKVGLIVRYLNAAGFGKFWDDEIKRAALAIKISGASKD